MKNLIIMFLLAGIATGHAQVIQLDEAKVTARTVKVKSNEGDLKFIVKENYNNEFVKNPIGFMKEHFDINLFIEQTKNKDYDSYRVEFRNNKGLLVANFDSKGNLVRTSQSFKNIPLPLIVNRKLVTDHKGWQMTKNKYLASGKGDVLNKELYKITLKNGNQTRIVKLIPDRPLKGLASN